MSASQAWSGVICPCRHCWSWAWTVSVHFGHQGAFMDGSIWVKSTADLSCSRRRSVPPVPSHWPQVCFTSLSSSAWLTQPVTETYRAESVGPVNLSFLSLPPRYCSNCQDQAGLLVVVE